jgi:spermidine/putrescine transport system ATP-binding protein
MQQRPAPIVNAAQNSGSELIRLEGVAKEYGPVVALADVTLGVRQGEFLALLGPSGCGKTTLLRLVAGFLAPTRGEILIDGQRMHGVPPNRRPVNTVFQNYALFPHLTVNENIAFGPRRRGVAATQIGAAVAETLALVGMEGFGARYPGELSGGQQQRVALARAIVNRPKVLLLDEPLGALDLKLRKRMQMELKHLHQRLGITFIFVTHDQEEALVMSDRIAVMNEGRVVQVGSGTEIYHQPCSRFVADFIGEANFLPCSAAGGRLVVDGTHVVVPGRPAAAGNSVVLMIRPEDVGLGRLDGGSGDAIVHVEAAVCERIFIGDATRIHLLLDNGQEIVAQPPRSPLTDRVAPGERVTIHWRAERARALDA